MKGFPALVLEEDGQFMLPMRGYQPFEQISLTLAKVLKGARASSEGTAPNGASTKDNGEIDGKC